MTRINTGVLLVVGILIFLGSIIHDMIGINFSQRTTIGPMDALVSLIGAVFMIPHMAVLSRSHSLSVSLAAIGAPVVLIALFHDAIGVYITQAITIGPIDTLVMLAGVLLMMPYLLSLAR